MARSFLGKGIAFPLRINAFGGMAMAEGAVNIEQGVRSILGTAIGERVMRGLRALDPIAYVRYASVYRRFEEATEFVQEVKKLEKRHDTLTARLPGL